MKVNEAPEKIILSADKDTKIIYDEWVIEDLTDNIKIEYTRTDAFMQKAERWLREVQKGFILTDKDITDFINYMKEGKV